MGPGPCPPGPGGVRAGMGGGGWQQPVCVSSQAGPHPCAPRSPGVALAEKHLFPAESASSGLASSRLRVPSPAQHPLPAAPPEPGPGGGVVEGDGDTGAGSEARSARPPVCLVGMSCHCCKEGPRAPEESRQQLLPPIPPPPSGLEEGTIWPVVPCQAQDLLGAGLWLSHQSPGRENPGWTGTASWRRLDWSTGRGRPRGRQDTCFCSLCPHPADAQSLPDKAGQSLLGLRGALGPHLFNKHSEPPPPLWCCVGESRSGASAPPLRETPRPGAGFPCAMFPPPGSRPGTRPGDMWPRPAWQPVREVPGWPCAARRPQR